MNTMRNPFQNEAGEPRTLAGLNLYSGSTRLAEMGARVGFDVVWIDMEHATCDLRAAEAVCVAVEAGGAIPLIRIAGAERDQLLHALEIGGRIVVVPMVNDAETARQLVRHGRYPPVGKRGLFGSSRGQRYGESPDWMAISNATTVLMAQIETREAVRNLDDILAVEGIGGIVVGPADLSADFGDPGNFEQAGFQDTVRDCLQRARAAGKHAGIVASGEPLIPLATDAGADLVVFTSDVLVLRQAWSTQLATFRDGKRDVWLAGLSETTPKR